MVEVPEKKDFSDLNTSSEPSTESAEDSFWKDEDLHNYITYKLPSLDVDEEFDLSAELLVFLFTGYFKESPDAEIGCRLWECIFYNASFLRSPKDYETRLLDDSDFRAEPTDYHQGYHLSNSKNFLNTLPTHDSTLLYLTKSLMTSDPKEIVCFASFLATILIRIMVVHPDTVIDYIRYEALEEYNKIFPKLKLWISPILPIPPKVSEILLRVRLDYDEKLFQSLFGKILDTYQKYMGDVDIRRYFHNLLLKHTKHYGLRIIRDYRTLTLQIRMKPEELEKYLFNEDTGKILKMLKKTYGNGSNDLLPYARVFDCNYMTEFSVNNHLKFAVLLIALLEPFNGPQVWEAKFLTRLNVSKDVIEEAKKSALAIYEKMAKEKPGVLEILRRSLFDTRKK